MFSDWIETGQILIDPEMRKIYDETGEQGLKGRESNRRGAAQEVWETWAEFKPFKRKLVSKVSSVSYYFSTCMSFKNSRFGAFPCPATLFILSYVLLHVFVLE